MRAQLLQVSDGFTDSIWRHVDVLLTSARKILRDMPSVN